MTVAYRPGDSLAHRLDPRAKLALQFGFAAAVYAHTTPRWLVGFGVATLLALRFAATPLLATLWAYRGFAPFLILGPVVQALRLGPPWLVPADAVGPALAAVRVALLVLLGAAYVRTTPVRASRAAIQQTVPGRAGTVLGMGVAFVFRLLPVLRDDLSRIREAIHARLGRRRGLIERIRLVGTTGLRRAFRRSDRFALALQARCFAWNPTLPALSFASRDRAALAVALGLAATALL
ncbi:MAG: energy-coupling factor transporter transmembrane protein EcfT [Halobacteriaceae archaeon]